MSLAIVRLWVCFFVIVMALTCWRPLAQLARKRRCTETVQGVSASTQNGTWVHGDGDETQLSRPVYRYEYDGEIYEVPAGVATMLYEYSPAAKRGDAPVKLQMNPSNPTEVYDADYERWFVKYRIIWGLVAFIALFALVNLLSAF